MVHVTKKKQHETAQDNFSWNNTTKPSRLQHNTMQIHYSKHETTQHNAKQSNAMKTMQYASISGSNEVRSGLAS